MPLELPKDVRAEALASLERYLEAHFEHRVGNIAAAALLNFFIEYRRDFIPSSQAIRFIGGVIARSPSLSLFGQGFRLLSDTQCNAVEPT